jgi:hypothetical protein
VLTVLLALLMLLLAHCDATHLQSDAAFGIGAVCSFAAVAAPCLLFLLLLLHIL